MDVVPFMGTNMNRWLPLLLLVQCILIISDAWHRVASLIVPSYLLHDVWMLDAANLELGKNLIRSEMVRTKTLFPGLFICTVICCWINLIPKHM